MTGSLIDSLQLAVVAMGIVFGALYILSLVMGVFPRLLGKQKAQAPQPQVAVAPVAEPQIEAVTADDAMSAQTVAVVAAAIAAYLGRSPQDLNVIAIRRTGSSLSPWALNVRRESIQN